MLVEDQLVVPINECYTRNFNLYNILDRKIQIKIHDKATKIKQKHIGKKKKMPNER
jgi:hypothetical protein